MSTLGFIGLGARGSPDHHWPDRRWQPALQDQSDRRQGAGPDQSGHDLDACCSRICCSNKKGRVAEKSEQVFVGIMCAHRP
jgi:hypothetical protein